MKTILIAPGCLVISAIVAVGQIETVWLGHRSSTPDKIVVNWETKASGNSVVKYERQDERAGRGSD